MASVITRYQITLSVVDQPGVLATIATLFADHGVSVEAVSQSVSADATDGSGDTEPTATLVVVTHQATEASLSATVDALSTSSVVSNVVSVLRVEGL
jgi:homoserine dehydrogenase